MGMSGFQSGVTSRAGGRAIPCCHYKHSPQESVSAFCVLLHFAPQCQLIWVLCLQSWTMESHCPVAVFPSFILWHILFSAIKCSSRMQCLSHPLEADSRMRKRTAGDRFITTLRTHAFKTHFFLLCLKKKFF